MMSLNEFKLWFDERFFALLEEKSKVFLSYSNSVSIMTTLSHLTVFAKEGKRLRPYMAYVGYVTEGGEHDIFELLATIELLHLFCLVHDDVMDNSPQRHNTSTFHTAFDVPMAILIGDMLLAWSFEFLQHVEEIEPYTIDDCRKEYNVMLEEVIHGQMLDVLSGQATRKSIEVIMQLKSAQYSFYRPLVIGMLLAGADNESIAFAKAYAVNLGLAFQLQDDLHDMYDDEKNGQQTLVLWYKHTNPDASLQETRSYVEQIIADHLEAAQDAVFAYNKDSEEIWEDTIEAVKRF